MKYGRNSGSIRRCKATHPYCRPPAGDIGATTPNCFYPDPKVIVINVTSEKLTANVALDESSTPPRAPPKQ